VDFTGITNTRLHAVRLSGVSFVAAIGGNQIGAAAWPQPGQL
jgi:hypothetical protein